MATGGVAGGKGAEERSHGGRREEEEEEEEEEGVTTVVEMTMERSRGRAGRSACSDRHIGQRLSYCAARSAQRVWKRWPHVGHRSVASPSVGASASGKGSQHMAHASDMLADARVS